MKMFLGCGLIIQVLLEQVPLSDAMGTPRSIQDWSRLRRMVQISPPILVKSVCGALRGSNGIPQIVGAVVVGHIIFFQPFQLFVEVPIQTLVLGLSPPFARQSA